MKNHSQTFLSLPNTQHCPFVQFPWALPLLVHKLLLHVDEKGRIFSQPQLEKKRGYFPLNRRANTTVMSTIKMPKNKRNIIQVH